MNIPIVVIILAFTIVLVEPSDYSGLGPVGLAPSDCISVLVPVDCIVQWDHLGSLGQVGTAVP